MILTGNKVLAIGDSITYDGTPTLNGAYRYYFGEPFSQWFRSNIEWVGENAATGANDWAGRLMCGMSGQRVDQINSNFDPGGQTLRKQPNLVICHLGTNDCTQRDAGTWAGTEADSVNNYSTLVTTVFANKPDTIFVACKIVPNKNAGSNALITSYNAALETMLLSHPNAASILIADCNAAFIANPSWSTDYMYNAAHPNDAGDVVMASTILSIIQANVTIMPRTPATTRAVSVGRTAIQTIPYSLRFNRATSDYLRVTANAAVYTPAQTAFTVLMRIYLNEVPSTTAQAPRFISFGGADINNRNFEFYAANANNAMQYRICNGTTNQLIGTSTSTYPTNQWLTLGCYYRQGVRLGIIRNTSFLNEATPTINLTMNIGQNLSLMSFGGTSGFTSGALGEFLMIDDDISADELSAWHYSGTIPTGATKLIHLRPSEGSGPLVNDLSLLNNDATLLGSTAWSTNPLMFPGARTAATARTNAA